MIVHQGEGVRRSFHGVDFVVLACGSSSMVTKMLYKPSDYVSSHCHQNEQSGYVISGEYKITIMGVSHIICAGDSYSIPRAVDHSIEVINYGQVVDVFVPPREDYL